MLKKYLALGIVALGIGALILTGCGKGTSEEAAESYSISGTVSWTRTSEAALMIFIGTDPSFPFPDDSWITNYEARMVTGTSSSTYNFSGLSSGTYYVGAIWYDQGTIGEPLAGDKLGEYSDSMWPGMGGTPQAIAATGAESSISSMDFSLDVTVP